MLELLKLVAYLKSIWQLATKLSDLQIFFFVKSTMTGCRFGVIQKGRPKRIGIYDPLIPCPSFLDVYKV